MKRRYLALLVIPLLIMLTGCPFLNKLPLWTLIPNIIRNIGQVVIDAYQQYDSANELEDQAQSILKSSLELEE